MAEPPVVVDAAWVEANLDGVRLVDVRDEWEYEAIGHLPGAVNVPFDTFRGTGDEDEGHLPGADRFAAVMSEAGIAPADVLVAYDDEHGVFAARFLVTAMLYGHRHWHLLDGDYSAWSRTSETTTEVTPVEPTDYRATVPEDRPLIDADGVLAAIEDSDAVLVDTRSPEEFKSGHIDGAVNFDWRELVDAETRGLKPREELERILRSYGVGPRHRIILYCNTARRISHTYIVLRHLGYDDVAFYEGSLTDWSARGLPLATDHD